MKNHLIFEGAELAGKSWIMSQVYERIEEKYNTSKDILNGCHWFNCDNGLFGTKHGEVVIENYLNIFREIKNKNIILEKFHISDKIYNKLYRKTGVDYSEVEKSLIQLNFKLIFIKFPENIEILEKRIRDRLNIYPHYERILKSPQWYIDQQKEYQKEFEKSNLDKLLIQTERLPDPEIIDKLLKWIFKNG